jgi:hypothetical protein
MQAMFIDEPPKFEKILDQLRAIEGDLSRL